MIGHRHRHRLPSQDLMKISRLSTAIITFALLATGLVAADKASDKLSPLDAAVPDESFLTLSLRIGKLLDKADYQKLVNWRPAIANNRGIADAIKELVTKPSSLGLSLKTPTHIFAQKSNGKNKVLVLLSNNYFKCRSVPIWITQK